MLPGLSPHHANPAPPDAARFRRTRDAHRDETAQDYVEAILQLIGSSGRARVRDLASMMGVSHVTVSRIVSRLERDGLLDRTPDITLTSKGLSLAKRIRRRHRVVLDFLLALGVPPRQAEIDAEGLEHHASDATIRAMRRWCGSRR